LSCNEPITACEFHLLRGCKNKENEGPIGWEESITLKN
jgi:hypothetical protein